MRSRLALVALLALAGCHRNASEVIPGADAEARRAAAQQTLTDLAAADDAARGPAPFSQPRAARVHPVRLMPDAEPDAAPQLPVAENVAQEEAPAVTH